MTGDRCNADGCQWTANTETTGDPEAALTGASQLALHALESGHALCPICFRSLTSTERRVCEACIERSQSLLAGVRTLFDELPLHLRTIAGNAHDRSRGTEDGRPLPGGDVLALLGPGSQGLDEDGETTRDGDPVSVAFELAFWERDWRAARREADGDGPPRSTSRLARDAMGYLERHTRWAATTHPGFEEYARDLRKLHARLEVATGRVRRPTPVNVDCFDCRGRLIRKIGKDGLEETGYTCRDCGKTYNAMQFAMSRAQAYLDASTWTDEDGGQWATLSALASRLDRSENTIRQWRRDKLVATVTVSGIVFFNVAQAEAENATRPKRSRSA